MWTGEIWLEKQLFVGSARMVNAGIVTFFMCCVPAGQHSHSVCLGDVRHLSQNYSGADLLLCWVRANGKFGGVACALLGHIEENLPLGNDFRLKYLGIGFGGVS